MTGTGPLLETGGGAALTARGYRVSAGSSSLSLNAVGTGAARWHRTAAGVARSTPFGEETVTLGRDGAEQSTVVDRHQGTRTWQWRLGTDLDPSLRPDGSVAVQRPGSAAAARIHPVEIYDAAGRNITPRGLHWTLRRVGAAWYLVLRLNDRHLPIPYVIDPSVTVNSLTATSLATSAIANYSVDLTTSNTGSGPLLAGDTITTNFVSFTATSNVVLTGSTWSTDDCSGTGSVTSHSTVITLSNSGGTCSIPINTELTYTVLGVTNASVAGSKTIDISTTVDSTVAAPTVTLVAATTVNTVSFSAAPQTAAAQSNSPELTQWTVGFTTSATNGALVGTSTISIVFNSSWSSSPPSLPASPTIVLGSGFTNCSATASSSGSTVTITLADSNGAGSCSAAANTAVQLTIDGITNPTTAGAYTNTTFTAGTSSDNLAPAGHAAASPSSNVSIAAATSPSSVTFSASALAAGATDTWTVGYTTSNTTGNTMYAGYVIAAVFSSAFNSSFPASPTITLTGSGYTHCSATATFSGSSTGTFHYDDELDVTLANSGGTCSIGPNTDGTFTVSGVTDPSAQTLSSVNNPPTQVNFGVLTSTDTGSAVAASSVQIYAADGSGTVSVSPSQVQVSATGQTLTFTYTAGTGGTSGGGVDLTIPSGWVRPQSTSSTSAGYVTVSTGTIGAITGSGPWTIPVTGLTLSAGATLTITYGANAGGGGGVTAPSSAQTSSFPVTEESTSAASFASVGSPSVSVVAPSAPTPTPTPTPISLSAPILSASDVDGDLILTWIPGTGPVDHYEILVNGELISIPGLTSSTLEYNLGPVSNTTGDTYQVEAFDASGDSSPPSNAVKGVPDLVGLPVKKAEQTLLADGFAVGPITGNSSGGVVTAQAPVAGRYANVGSDVAFTVGSQPRPTLVLVGSKRIDLERRHYTAIHVVLKRAATLTTTLTLHHATFKRWRKRLGAGTWILRYHLPQHLSAATYKLTVAATTSGGRRAATIRVGIGYHRTTLGQRARVEVVDSSTAGKTIRLGVRSQVIRASAIWHDVFWKRDLGVVVLKVTRKTLSLLRNLAVVFPQVHLVAVTTSAAVAARARTYSSAVVVATNPAQMNAGATKAVRWLLKHR